MLYLLPDFWNSQKLVFLTLSDSLFADSHLLILLNWSLTALNNVFMLVYLKKLVSPVNIIETSTFKVSGSLFTCNKNNNGLSIEPCATPHLISFLLVSADLVIFIYCFLLSN